MVEKNRKNNQEFKSAKMKNFINLHAAPLYK
jgi:hypothetical protein